MANHDCKINEPKAVFRKEKFSHDDQYSGRHWINTHRVNSVEIQSSANFLSMNSAGQISVSSSSSLSNENPSSTIVTGETLKDYVVSTQSSNCVPCRVNVSSKSDISSETGPLVRRGSSGLESVKSEGRQKHMTESSCSNSIQISVPVSSSNESFLEMSTGLRPHTLGANSSITTGFLSSMEELVARGTVSDIASQSSIKSFGNGREGDELKVSGLVSKQNVISISSLHSQRSVNGMGQVKEHFRDFDNALGTARNGAKGTADEISICRAASESISTNKESNDLAVDARFFHFRNSGKSSCLTETEQPAAPLRRKCQQRGASYLDIVDQEFMKQQPFSDSHQPKAPHPLGLYELSGLNHEDKANKSVSALPAKFHPDLFDLNEDSRESKSHVQSNCETGSPFNVIRVLAKPGVPLNVPVTCQKLESEMSWKGSAATSAFRSTNLKIQASQGDCAPTNSKGLTGFDLNVAAGEDDAESELHLGVGRALDSLIPDTSLKINCIKAERLDFDLNCLGDIYQGASLPTTLMKTEIVDPNLNEGSTGVDKCDDGRRKHIPSQHIAKVPFNSHGVSFATSSGDHGANVIRPAYWSDFSNIQFYSQSQMQPFLMTSPNPPLPVEHLQKVVQLHPKLPYIIPSLPPQGYPSNGPFFVCPNGLVPSNMHYSTPVQYSTDPRVQAVFPQRISHAMVPSVSGGPHFMQMVHGNARSQNQVASIRPCTDVVSGGIPAFNSSPTDTRQYFPSSKCSSVEEQMRVPPVPPRRTEPEGAVFPQRISHTRVPSVSGGPYLMQMVHGRSQNEVAEIRPRSDVVNGRTPAFNGNPRNTQQYFPPSKRSSIEEQTRMPPKRTEPEGGHDTFELRTRQLTSWN